MKFFCLCFITFASFKLANSEYVEPLYQMVYQKFIAPGFMQVMFVPQRTQILQLPQSYDIQKNQYQDIEHRQEEQRYPQQDFDTQSEVVNAAPVQPEERPNFTQQQLFAPQQYIPPPTAVPIVPQQYIPAPPAAVPIAPPRQYIPPPTAVPIAPQQYVPLPTAVPIAPQQYITPATAIPIAPQQYITSTTAVPIAPQQFVTPPTAVPIAPQQYITSTTAVPIVPQKYLTPTTAVPVVAPLHHTFQSAVPVVPHPYGPHLHTLKHVVKIQQPYNIQQKILLSKVPQQYYLPNPRKLLIPPPLQDFFVPQAVNNTTQNRYQPQCPAGICPTPPPSTIPHTTPDPREIPPCEDPKSRFTNLCFKTKLIPEYEYEVQRTNHQTYRTNKTVRLPQFNATAYRLYAGL